MIIGNKQLHRLIRQDKIVEGIDYIFTQVQPNGIDLTVDTVEAFDGPGELDYGNDRRKVPPGVAMKWQRDPECKDFEHEEWLFLEQGCYRVTFREYVSIPRNMCAFTWPRSSLLRMGATIDTAVGDAGYNGNYQAMLDVRNPHGLKLYRRARIAQLVYAQLDEEQPPEVCYKGRYQGEKHKCG